MLKKNFLKAIAILIIGFFCGNSSAQSIDQAMHDVDMLYKKKKEQFIYGDENFGILLTQYRKGKKSTLVMLEPYKDGESSGTRIAREWYKGKISATYFYTPDYMEPDSKVFIRMDYRSITFTIKEDPSRLSISYNRADNFTPGELNYAIYTENPSSSFVISECNQSTGKHCNPDFTMGGWRQDYGYFSGVFETNPYQDKELVGYAAVDNHTKIYGRFSDGNCCGQLNAVYYKNHPSKGTAVLIGEFNYYEEPFTDYFLLEEGQAYMVFLDERDEKEIERVRITKYINESLPLGR